MGGLDAGALDRAITWQTATVIQNPGSGEEGIDWTTVAEEPLWAQWFPATTREAYEASQQVGARVSGVFRIYDRARPSPKANRIVWDGLTYDVKPAIEIGRREGWDVPVIARDQT